MNSYVDHSKHCSIRYVCLALFFALSSYSPAISQEANPAEKPASIGHVSSLIKSMNDENLSQKNHLKDLGKTTSLEEVSELVLSAGSFNSRPIPATGNNRKEIQSALSDSLAIFLSSIGLEKNDIKRLEKKGYNAIYQAEKVMLLEGTAIDFIALSANPVFGVLADRDVDTKTGESTTHIKLMNEKVKQNDNNSATSLSVQTLMNDPINRVKAGTECLFFLSDDYGKFNKKRGKGDNKFIFQPFCQDGLKFTSINHYMRGQSFSKEKLNSFITLYSK